MIIRKTLTLPVILILSFFVGLYVSFYSSFQSGNLDLASRSPARAERQWSLSGYLPENPQQKIYLMISGPNIYNIQTQRPTGLVLETNSIIFPGPIDMHNHIKYNILPLWNMGRSQFLNRFEWRQKFSPYKDAVSFNMRPIRGDTVCAAVRWAEIKALVGGATAMQGIGTDMKCARQFGVLNVEIPGELVSGKVRALTDLILPDAMSVYEPGIAPEVRNRYREWAYAEDGGVRLRNVYDQALYRLLNQTGIDQWLHSFANEPRSLALGIKLLIGLEVSGPPNPTEFPIGHPQAFERFVPQIEQFLISQYGMNANAITNQLNSMRLWLYGRDQRSGYFSVNYPSAPLQGFALIEDSKTMEYFGKAGVISVDRRVRRYLAMFERPTRRSVLSSFDRGDVVAVIAHLAEGMRHDQYNSSEYGYTNELGLARPGLVMIHAVGLNTQQLQDAARKGISIVWSPFSNLLLYGETLDIVAAKNAGVNIAMGADWTPTGSKNIIDELKIARRYLNKIRVPYNIINDKDLVDMVTVNAGKALNSRTVGRVHPGAMANLLLLDKSQLNSIPNPWTALINSEQEHIQLMVVAGEPLYGDVSLITEFAQSVRDPAPPEILPKHIYPQTACQFQKGIRFPAISDYDKTLQSKNMHFLSVAAIEHELKTKMGEYAREVRNSSSRQAQNLLWLDPLFKCEDEYYRNEFNRYIEVTLDLNLAQRSQLRQQFNLNNDWSPIRQPPPEEDNDQLEPSDSEL